MNCYNEKRYLNGDTEALKTIYYWRDIHLKEKAEEIGAYSDVVDEYDLFLDEVADELLKYDLNNPLEYSIALNYLIRKGYLSADETFKRRESFEEITGKLGINIVSGRGCCRNISGFHKDVFDKLGIYSKEFYCYLGCGTGTNGYANHVINLVEYDDNVYGIDLLNYNTLYHFKKPMKMELISLFNAGKVIYKPYYEITMGESDLESIKETIKQFENYSKIKPISALEYDRDIRYRTNKIMRDNKSKLDDFSKKTKVLKKSIADNMPRL